jgi:hypothetical protein
MRHEPCRRDGAPMTLEEVVVAVQRHRRQMAPLVTGLTEALGPDAARSLVDVLTDGDRRLGRLCDQLSQHLGPPEEPAGRDGRWM